MSAVLSLILGIIGVLSCIALFIIVLKYGWTYYSSTNSSTEERIKERRPKKIMKKCTLKDFEAYLEKEIERNTKIGEAAGNYVEAYLKSKGLKYEKYICRSYQHHADIPVYTARLYVSFCMMPGDNTEEFENFKQLIEECINKYGIYKGE